MRRAWKGVEMDKKVSEWRVIQDDLARMRQLEEEVTQGWLESLTEDQRTVFFELMDSPQGVLQEMLVERRIKGAVRKHMTR